MLVALLLVCCLAVLCCIAALLLRIARSLDSLVHLVGLLDVAMLSLSATYSQSVDRLIRWATTYLRELSLKDFLSGYDHIEETRDFVVLIVDIMCDWNHGALGNSHQLRLLNQRAAKGKGGQKG